MLSLTEQGDHFRGFIYRGGLNLLTKEEFYKTLNEEIDYIKTRVLLISKLSIEYLIYGCGCKSTRILLKIPTLMYPEEEYICLNFGNTY